MEVIDLKIRTNSRHKIVIIINRETKEELIKNIDLGRINLDKWLHD